MLMMYKKGYAGISGTTKIRRTSRRNISAALYRFGILSINFNALARTPCIFCASLMNSTVLPSDFVAERHTSLCSETHAFHSDMLHIYAVHLAAYILLCAEIRCNFIIFLLAYLWRTYIFIFEQLSSGSLSWCARSVKKEKKKIMTA